MTFNIINPVLQTQIFAAVLFIAVLVGARKSTEPHKLNISLTRELKGVAILMVIFSHVGYFLSTDSRFLFPLSTLGGVGVNLFLFLSGFGLTISELQKKKTIVEFYIKRLRVLFVPLWMTLIIFMTLDYFVLGRSYSFDIIYQSFLGYIQQDDLFQSFNSPLWYFTLILFYYIIFPLVFTRKYPLISVALILLISGIVLNMDLHITEDLLKMYKVHSVAFPLGMSAAYIITRTSFMDVCRNLANLVKPAAPVLRYILILAVVILFAHTTIHSGVGTTIRKEQLISLFTMTCLIVIFLAKKFQFQFLMLLGIYSYEIYLIHWPLMYRYDYVYRYLSPSLATVAYLGILLYIGYLFSKLSKIIIDRVSFSYRACRKDSPDS